MDKLSAFDWFFLLETRFLIYNELLENGLAFWVGIDELNENEEQEAIQLIMYEFFNHPVGFNLAINFQKNKRL